MMSLVVKSLTESKKMGEDFRAHNKSLTNRRLTVEVPPNTHKNIIESGVILAMGLLKCSMYFRDSSSRNISISGYLYGWLWPSRPKHWIYDSDTKSNSHFYHVYFKHN